MQSIIGPIVAALTSLAGVIYSTRRTARVIGENAPANTVSAQAPTPGEARRWRIMRYGSLICLAISVAFVGRDIIAKLPLESEITVDPIGPLVGQTELMSGTATRLPSGSTAWIVIRSLAVNRLYPQNDPVGMMPDHKWSSLVFFGNARDSSNKFEVLVTIADEHAQQEFRDYLSHARGLSEGEGIGSLPATAIVQARFVVTRK